VRAYREAFKEYEPGLGIWSGWINPGGRSGVRIVAVVVPPNLACFSSISRS
jgi:hypothetical protein